MENTLLSVYEQQLVHAVPGRTILTVVNSRLEPSDHDFFCLDESSGRAAACLTSLGCSRGDRVLISLRETVPLWSFFWGALRIGAVPCVLFPDLGPGGLEVRLKAAEAVIWVTDADPVKLSGKILFPASLKKVITLSGASDPDFCFTYRAADWPAMADMVPVRPDEDAFIVFTSGTTGTPKPVVHRHGIADAVVRSMKNVLHAEPEDIFWCTAHPAWITGTVYGLLGPVLSGIPSVRYDGAFHAKRWLPILEKQKISLWYTAPTALRALMREDEAFYQDFDLSSLRQIYSIGEPLAAPVCEWVEKVFHRPIYDTWFQTECGTIRIAGQPGTGFVPGTMGNPVDDAEARVELSGALRLKAGFSSMFSRYDHMEAETAAKVSDGWYDTGDLVTVTSEGALRFIGRADEVINTSGHLVGPLEVEQVLAANPAVAAAGVTSEADELLYEVPVAYLVLETGAEWSRQLESALKAAVSNGLSVYAIPKRFYIIRELPLTASGKIDRKSLPGMRCAG